MDKNTIWAIVLSTLVIIGAYLLMPKFMGKNNVQEDSQSVTVIDENAGTGTNTASNSIIASDSTSIFSDNDLALTAEDEEIPLTEEKITINTGCAEIIFTTKGGDIISYKLVNHIDMDTKDGIQISDSINEMNRTCALALGTAGNTIINEYFSYERPDPYTIFFKRNFKTKDTFGNEKSFMLGKKYTFMPNEYMFKLEIMIHSNDGKGLDFNGVAYTLRTSPQIGPHFNAKQNRYENRQFVAYNGKKAKRTILSNGQFKKYDKDLLWGGIGGKYFIELVIPTDSSIWNASYYSSQIEQNDYANAQALFERKAFAGTDVMDTYYMYFGPRNEKDLKIYNMSENNQWHLSGNRLTESLQSSGWLSWLETILKWGLETLHKIIKNWGVCIIIITLILRILMTPLSIKQSKSTKKMQELQPKLQAVQSKYANDKQKLQTETQKIYQEAGYNPASGCLPMVFQFIILIAMYNLFNNYFEFRGAMFIPKLIPDLSTGDSVVSFNFNIPFLGNQLRLLPIIYTLTQIFSTKLTQATTPGGGGGQNEMTMKFMTYGMPIMFFFLFYNAPSGLLLYWLTSNVLMVVQQVIINKKMAKDKPAKPENNKPQKTLPPKGKKR